ncbi:MAG: NAD-dependent epimerase/dehydratase family protein [Candidatus Micrarchaeia archaeon]
MEENRHINLITGATSHLGISIAKKLIEAGEEVRAIIPEKPAVSSEWKNLPPGVKPYVVNLTFKNDEDKKNLEEALEGVDRVFHFAGAVFNYKFTYNQFIDINVIGTENLLRTAKEVNLRTGGQIHFLYSSSVTVYGYRRRGVVLTEDSELKPASPYSESKVMAEQVIKSYCDAYPNMKYTIFRLATFFGDGYNAPIFKVFNLVKEGKMPIIGDGKNFLTFVNIEDIIEAFILASSKNEASSNKIYNLTDGVNHEMKALLDLAASLLNVKPPEKRVNFLLANLARKVMDINYDEFEFITSDRIISIDKIKKELGFFPKKTLENEASELVKEFLEKGKMLNS